MPNEIPLNHQKVSTMAKTQIPKMTHLALSLSSRVLALKMKWSSKGSGSKKRAVLTGVWSKGVGRPEAETTEIRDQR